MHALQVAEALAAGLLSDSDLLVRDALGCTDAVVDRHAVHESTSHGEGRRKKMLGSAVAVAVSLLLVLSKGIRPQRPSVPTQPVHSPRSQVCSSSNWRGSRYSRSSNC